jgi:hypothetical protein
MSKFETHCGTKRRSQQFIRVDSRPFLDWLAAYFGTRRVSTGNTNRLSRWQFVQAVQEQILRSKDYLHSLQVRNKWTKSHPNIKINDLIIVINLQLPPSRWKLARVVQVHPGSDGHVRVVILRTACSHYKRPIAQICKLPMSSENNALKSEAP